MQFLFEATATWYCTFLLRVPACILVVSSRGPGFAFLRVRSSPFSDNRSNWSSSLSLTLASAPWGPGRGSGRSLVYFLLSLRNWEVMAPQKMGKVLHQKVVIYLEDLRLGGGSSSSFAEH